MSGQPTITIETAAILAGTTPRRIKHLIHVRVIATVDAAPKGLLSSKTLEGVLILQEPFVAFLAAGGTRNVSFPSRTAQRNRKAAYQAQQTCRTGAA